jgi:hypothetical protein
VVILCNSIIAVAGAVLAFFIWAFTWAEYGKVSLYTKCFTVTYFPDRSASTWSDYMYNCNEKFANYQCICSNNEEDFCTPYTTTNDVNCSSIINVYYMELQCSLGLLALCMITLGVYVLSVYGSLIYYAQEAFVVPPIFIKVYERTMETYNYTVLVLTPTEDHEENTRMRNMYNKTCRFIYKYSVLIYQTIYYYLFKCYALYCRKYINKYASVAPESDSGKNVTTDSLVALEAAT